MVGLDQRYELSWTMFHPPQLVRTTMEGASPLSSPQLPMIENASLSVSHPTPSVRLPRPLLLILWSFRVAECRQATHPLPPSLSQVRYWFKPLVFYFSGHVGPIDSILRCTDFRDWFHCLNLESHCSTHTHTHTHTHTPTHPHTHTHTPCKAELESFKVKCWVSNEPPTLAFWGGRGSLHRGEYMVGGAHCFTDSRI